MSIIRDMFYGEIEIQDSFCQRQEYQRALKKLIDADLSLRQMLSEEQKALLDKAKQCGNILN